MFYLAKFKFNGTELNWSVWANSKKEAVIKAFDELTIELGTIEILSVKLYEDQ